MPTANPAEANRAMNDVVSMPRKLITTIKSRNIIATRSIDKRKVVREASTFRRVKSRWKNRITWRMIQRPM